MLTLPLAGVPLLIMNKSIYAKSMLIWLGIIPLAFLNGALREAVLIPALGSMALPVSGIILSALVLLLTYIFIYRLGKNKQTTYIKIGLVWISATIIFEFAFGMAIGESLENMLAAYNIFTGNLWSFVIVVIGLSPWLTAKTRKII